MRPVRFATSIFDGTNRGTARSSGQLFAAIRAAQKDVQQFRYVVVTDTLHGQTTQRVSFVLVNNAMRYVVCNQVYRPIALSDSGTHTYIGLALQDCRRGCHAPDWCDHPNDACTLERVDALAQALAKHLQL